MKDLAPVIQGIYEAFGGGNIPAVLETLADDVRWDEWADNSAAKAGVPWLRTRRGKDGVAEFFAVLGRDLAITEFRVLSLMTGGNQVVAEVMVEARKKQ